MASKSGELNNHQVTVELGSWADIGAVWANAVRTGGSVQYGPDYRSNAPVTLASMGPERHAASVTEHRTSHL